MRRKTLKNLTDAEIGTEYIITSVDTHNDDEMQKFLFSLGCYEGETITVISRLHKNYVINIKDARYSIDEDLAMAIQI